MGSGNGRTKRATASAPTGARRGRRPPGPEHRRELIERTAYFLSERRGFDPRWDVENWLEAERQVDAGFARSPASSGEASRA